MSSIATSYKKTVEEFLTQMVDSIARMLDNNIGGTIVFNFYHKEPFNDLMLEAMCKEAMGPNPAPINLSLEEIFGNKNHPYHDGAVVINVFDHAFYAASVKFPAEAKGYLIPSPKELKHLGTRHYSAYCYSFFTNALIVVVSEEKARISVFKQGTFQLGESKLYDKLVLAAKDFKNDKENGWISSGQSGYFFHEQHFTVYFSISPFGDNETTLDWFKPLFVQTHTQLHLGATLCVGDETITPTRPGTLDYNKLISYIEFNMEENLKRYAQWAPVGIAQCSILKYGPKVLGGFFYGIIGDTILLGHPFMDRQMLHDGFAARFLTEVVAKKLHPNCKNFKAFLPEHLIDPFDGFLKAVNATKDFGIREQCQRLSFSVDEKLNVGFSFKIPRSRILEEIEELFALDQASQDIIKSRNPLKPTIFESLIDEPLD